MTGGAAWWNSTTAMARKATATWPLSWATRMPRKTNPTLSFLSKATTRTPPASRSREKNSKPWPTALLHRSSGGTERNATQTKIVMRSPYTMSHLACRLIGLLQLCLLPLIALASPPTPWKTDCVGRFNLDLPAQVEVTMPFDVLYRYPNNPSPEPSRGAVAFFAAGAGYHFPGAKQTTGVYEASGKDTQWVKTTIGTGPKVDAAGFAQHGQAFDQNTLDDKRYFLEKSSRKEIAATINLIETDLPNSRVWSQGGSYTYLLWRDGRLFSIKDWDEPDLRNEFVPLCGATHTLTRTFRATQGARSLPSQRIPAGQRQLPPQDRHQLPPERPPGSGNHLFGWHRPALPIRHRCGLHQCLLGRSPQLGRRTNPLAQPACARSSALPPHQAWRA